MRSAEYREDVEETIGARLRRLRRAVPLTQEQLAASAGVSVDVVQKLEQDRRLTARTSTLVALARGLDVDLAELVDRRARLDHHDDGGVLALRDALLSPALLDGVVVGDADQASTVDAISSEVDAAWARYWAGQFSVLVAALPELLARARTAHREHGVAAVGPLTHAYQLAAGLCVQMGKDDLAAIAGERGVVVAAGGDDELVWATAHGAYAQALLHQGRTLEAEEHALAIAARIEPSISQATLPQLTVWGGLVLWAMAAAAAGGRRDAALECVGLARSAAGRFEHDRLDYQMNFGRNQVAMQEVHTYAMVGEPGRALDAAGAVRREGLRDISWCRHLIDVAQAQVDARDYRSAEATLHTAEGQASEWFRHQGPARELVHELVHESRRLSPGLRHLARAARIDR
jgi:transcriptional regulator with XRE-family HTH domain